MKTTTLVFAMAIAITSVPAFAAENGGGAAGANSTAAGASGGTNAGNANGKSSGDFSETGGRSNHGTTGNNPVGQVAPGTSNAPAGNAATK